MTALGAQPSDSGSWDQPFTSSLVARRTAPAAPIPDDWDNDDDDDHDANGEDSQRIWENANTKTPTPMPDVVISTSMTSTPSIVSQPSVFRPPMRILRRPSHSQSTGPSSSSSSSGSSFHRSLAEREAQYQAARERIFGDEKGEAKLAVYVVRNPHGPDESEGVTAKGFSGRKKDANLIPPPPSS